MRWPIRLQLLCAMLFVVVLAASLSGAAGAYLSDRWARQQQQEDLRRVVAALTDARFPLTENVLRKMSGLSGADFVVLDPRGRVQASTVEVTDEELTALGRAEPVRTLENFSASPTVTLGETRYLSAGVELERPTPGRVQGVLLVLYPEDQWWTATRGAAYPAVMAGVVAALVAVLLTTVIAQRFVRSLARLRAHTTQIAEGTFEPMPLPQRNDELRDLTGSINRMVGRLAQYERQVRHNERLHTLGQLGAEMAHQLRNWGTGAKMALSFHEQECADARKSDSFNVAVRQLNLMDSYLQRYLSLGRTASVSRETVHLEEMVEDVLELVRPASRHARIELQWQRPAKPVRIEADRTTLKQLIVNLLLNAMEAAGHNGAALRLGERGPLVRVEVQQRHAKEVVLKVRDSGPGPPEDIQDRLFEPFVTAKPEGIGLGLSVAQQIAEAHGATLSWSRQDGTTCFLVTFSIQMNGSSDGAPSDCG